MTIPEDIMKTATDIAKRWYHEEWDPDSYIQIQLVRYIAEALVEARNKALGAAADEARQFAADMSSVRQDDGFDQEKAQAIIDILGVTERRIRLLKVKP